MIYCCYKNIKRVTEKKMKDLFEKIKNSKAALAAVVIILAAILVLVVLLNRKNRREQIETAETPAPITDAPVTPAQTESPIKVNIIAELPAAEAVEDKLEVVRNKRDAVTLDYVQAREYFGTEIYPKVPEDLIAEAENGNFEIYRHNGGKGDVYRDVFVLNYSNTDMTRHINIEGSKSKYTLEEIEQWHGAGYKLSLINGENVYFALNDGTDYYFAQFEHNGVGFRIIMAGLTEQEAISVVESLV